MLLLEIRFNIYSALNIKKYLVFRHGLICPRLWLAQPAAFDSPDDCIGPKGGHLPYFYSIMSVHWLYNVH